MSNPRHTLTVTPQYTLALELNAWPTALILLTGCHSLAPWASRQPPAKLQYSRRPNVQLHGFLDAVLQSMFATEELRPAHAHAGFGITGEPRSAASQGGGSVARAPAGPAAPSPSCSAAAAAAPAAPATVAPAAPCCPMPLPGSSSASSPGSELRCAGPPTSASSWPATTPAGSAAAAAGASAPWPLLGPAASWRTGQHWGPTAPRCHGAAGVSAHNATPRHRAVPPPPAGVHPPLPPPWRSGCLHSSASPTTALNSGSARQRWKCAVACGHLARKGSSKSCRAGQGLGVGWWGWGRCCVSY